jgi:hypothetical protein
MTSVREDLGYLPQEPKFPKRPPEARFEGVRDLGDEGWEASVLKPDGRRVWLYASTRMEAINRARNYAAALNGGAK